MSSFEELYESDDSQGLLERARPSRLSKGVASLIGREDTTQDPRAHTRAGSSVYAADTDVDYPDGDVEKYWQEYKENPIIARQLWNLSDDVFEAGWWITADSEETEDEITEFCNNITISAGQVHRSFGKLGRMAIIQHEARGTFLGEKMTDDQGRHTGINPVNPTTFKMYSKPGVNVLLPPDYDHDDDTLHTKETADGDTAAYVQFDTVLNGWKDREERRFTRDEILHWARNPDLGSARGNSVIEPIYERSRALREKLQDNDLAIAMKAWPMVMFQVGTPEHPWNEDEQEDFIQDYSQEELGPGMFQAVPGDVEVNEFAGETADIEEHVQTDVDMIVSALPGQKSQLGAFHDAGEQRYDQGKPQHRKHVRSLRRELEDLFTPYLKEVAESWGYSSDGLELHIGRPGDQVAPEDVQGSIIRYQSDVQDAKDGETQPAESPETDAETPPEDGRSAVDDGVDDMRSMEGELGNGNRRYGRNDQQVELLTNPHVELGESVSETAALADPRLVSLTGLEHSLGDDLADLLVSVRERTLERIEESAGNGTRFEQRDSERAVRRAYASLVRSTDIESTIESAVVDALEKTLDTLEQESHAPRIHPSPSAQHKTIVETTRRAIQQDCQALAMELAQTVRQQIDMAQYDADDGHRLRQRVLDVWDDGTIGHRARLIARMRLRVCTNRTKLHHYRETDDVVGVEIASRCGANTHRLTADLAGCDGSDTAVAYFDAEDSLGMQFQSQTSVTPPQGFDPLPDAPPFHFGDRTEIVPVTE